MKLLDRIATWWCYHFHPGRLMTRPVLRTDGSQYQCLACGRIHRVVWQVVR